MKAGNFMSNAAKSDVGFAGPDILYLKDPVIDKVTNGDYSKHTFLTISDNDMLYRFALEFIPDNLYTSDSEHGTASNNGVASSTQQQESESEGFVVSNMFSYRAQYFPPRSGGYGGGGNQHRGKRTGGRRGQRFDEFDPEQAASRSSANREEDGDTKYTTITAGFGLFTLWFKPRAQKVYCLHKSIGEPVGTMNGTDIHRVLVFFVPGENNKQVLIDIVEHLAEINQVEAPPDDVIEVYRFNLDFMGWQRFYNARARPEKSVVLPKETKRKILEDVREFIDVETKKWYYEKGIPYKRSYLFYGVPGSGKTSIISVLAGYYKRPICYISPTDPRMTDEILKRAVQDSVANGIIIFEDVDGLFGKDRQSNVHNALTFSGLLNALDGVGSGLGQIFILTTNYRERLDNALIRNGRVDLQIEFTYVNEEQVHNFFALFYPQSDEAARNDFTTRVFDLCKAEFEGEPCISAAMLQNFFIMHRKCSYQEAIDSVSDLIEEVKNARTDAAEREERKKLQEQKEKNKATRIRKRVAKLKTEMSGDEDEEENRSGAGNSNGNENDNELNAMINMFGKAVDEVNKASPKQNDDSKNEGLAETSTTEEAPKKRFWFF